MKNPPSRRAPTVPWPSWAIWEPPWALPPLRWPSADGAGRVWRCVCCSVPVSGCHSVSGAPPCTGGVPRETAAPCGGGCAARRGLAVDDGLSLLLRPEQRGPDPAGFLQRPSLDLAAYRHPEPVFAVRRSRAGPGCRAGAALATVLASLGADCTVCAAGHGGVCAHVSQELHLLWCAARHGRHAAACAADGALGPLALVAGRVGHCYEICSCLRNGCGRHTPFFQ